ncbi:MAG: fibronectin type III domain-containing protein, partial [Pseudomonadota bacterium]
MLPTTGFNAASAVAAITGVASSVLGVPSYAQAMMPPVFDANGKTSDINTLKLAALANVIGQHATGADLNAKLQDIANKLAAGSAVNAVIPPATWSAAVTAVNAAGVGGMLPNGVTPPTIPAFTLPGTSLGNAISGGGTVGASASITGFNPITGAAGATVTIMGTNLVTAFPPAPIVKFGTTGAGTPYTNVSNTGITFTVPAGLAAGNHTLAIGGMSGTPMTVGTFTVTAAPVTTVPVTPVGMSAIAASTTQIDLTWTAVAGASSYNIYRGTAIGVVVGAASKINTTTVTTASFNNTGLTAATAYYYKVAAVNAVGEGVASAEVNATTSAAGGGVTPTPVAGLMGG